MLPDDPLGGHGEAILIPNPLKNERNLELRRLRCAFGIELECLYSVSLSGLDDRGRFNDHATHVLEPFDEIGLAAGVSAIEHSTSQQSGSGLEVCGECVSVLKCLVLRGNKAQDLLIAQASEILNAELYEHLIIQLDEYINSNLEQIMRKRRLFYHLTIDWCDGLVGPISPFN